jgi:ZIP family zinc transporter
MSHDHIPLWLIASGWALFVTLGLLAGAAVGVFAPFRHRGVARVMAVGAGILIAAASLDLIGSAVTTAGPLSAGLALLLGAGLFSGANALLATKDAMHRKRCGECVPQPSEKIAPGSGMAIALGTLIDGVPEAIVLGLETTRMTAPGLGLVAALAIGNFAEALSSASGMQAAGRSKRYIFGLWSLVAFAVTCIAGVSALFAGLASHAVVSLCNAFAAGALLAMVVETMIPEAAADVPPLNGLLAVSGFLALLLLIGAA